MRRRGAFRNMKQDLNQAALIVNSHMSQPKIQRLCTLARLGLVRLSCPGFRQTRIFCTGEDLLLPDGLQPGTNPRASACFEPSSIIPFSQSALWFATHTFSFINLRNILHNRCYNWPKHGAFVPHNDPLPLRLSTASLSFAITSAGSLAPNTALPATITLAPASAA